MIANPVTVRCFFALFFCFFIPALHAQSIEQYVKQNTVAIASIQPDFDNDSDLEVIGKAIGNATIVLLGEQDHGDAPTFLAKTRLIKYLHEKKGFNVLAFESDFFGLNEGWERLNKTERNIDSFLQTNVTPVWTFCDACHDLFYQYIPATYHTDQPLQISGFDNQMTQQYSRQSLVHQLDSVLEVWQLPVTKQPDYSTAILPFIDSLPAWSFHPAKVVRPLQVLQQSLQQIKTELKEKVTEDDFWLHIVDNLIAETTECLFLANNKKRENPVVRDSQMAMNIKWLSEVKYLGKKIMVWAANVHISKSGAATTKETNKESGETMGGFLADDSVIKKRMYVLGFTSCQGTAGNIFFKPYPVQKTKTDGFSNWIYSGLHYPYAFTDFKLYNQSAPGRETFIMRGFGHLETKNNWTDLFDGVFYIQDMYPCRNTYLLPK